MPPSSLWMDYVQTPLNPCSLESIPEPIALASSEDEDDFVEDNNNIFRTRLSGRKGTTTRITQRVWPIMLSYHELEGMNQRGKLDLYTVEVPNMNRNRGMVLRFGSPRTVLDSTSSERDTNRKYDYTKFSLSRNAPAPSSPPSPLHISRPSSAKGRNGGGILDGKWLSLSSDTWWYASAHSTGEIFIHSCQVSTESNDNSQNSRRINASSCDLNATPSFDYSTASSSFLSRDSNDCDNDLDEVFQVKCMGKSDSKQHASSPSSPSSSLSPSLSPSHSPSSSLLYYDFKPLPFCLSVNWDSSACSSSRPITSNRRLVSSYSDGRIAIHTVTHLEKTNTIQLIEMDSWQAHTMFTCPSEAWSACFVGPNNCGENHSATNNLVLSGGDDGFVKFWDIRCTHRPMHLMQPFDAGVTVISPHPRKEYLFACGSYDETITLNDVRYISSSSFQAKQRRSRRRQNHRNHQQRQTSISRRCAPLGGGIWRIKWHPYDDGRILVAAMHGGCRILQIDGLQETAIPPSPPPSTTSTSSSSSVASSNDSVGFFTSSNINGNFDSTFDSHHPYILSGVKDFTEHESIVYGADWLVCQHPTQEGYFEAAASCSFYDKSVYLWDTVA